MGDFGRKVDQFLDVFFNKGGMDSVLQGLQNTLIIAVSGLIIDGIIGIIIAMVRVLPKTNLIV